MAKKYICEAEVLHNDETAPGIRKLIMSAPEPAQEAQPGQFINIYPKSDRLILPRPISICSADADEGLLTVVYDVVGAGTEELSNMVRGDLIRISSPLGNGFPMPEAADRPVLLVGGGVGNAPLLFLAERLAKQSGRIIAVAGFRKDPFLIEELREADCRVLVTTDIPGEHSFVGNVIDCMEINQLELDESWTCYACGPKPMLESVYRFVKGVNEKMKIWVSLEERMGCGYGACVGCATNIRVSEDGSEVIQKLKVCKDGPVFNGEAVVW
jgi:dihydroorotate dehydrogenase electron transfer subunit